MPDKEAHFEIIDKNYKALMHLSSPDPSEHIEWSVIIIYYMALHYIQAYFDATCEEHYSNHMSLQNRMREVPQLRSIYGRYRQLEDDSRKARYDGETFNIYTLRNETLKSFQKIQDLVLSWLENTDRNSYNLYKLFPPN
ncbi:hypothetical protein [Desulfamplus magnetovallimortis]|nr:hypothetical protein [Desulfamplus magnetovallimortis]